jgi:excisionase family DNA binding protein
VIHEGLGLERTARNSQFPARRLLRCAQAATYLGVGTKRIRQLILDGELPYVQLQPGNSPFLIDVRDLDRFIESRKANRQY